MFSEVVDEVAKRSGRTEKVSQIAGMTNAILRRLHSKALFDRDFLTACAVPDHSRCVEGAVVWKRPKNFRVLRTAKVGAQYMRFERVGRNLEGRKFFYYAEGEYFIFQTGDFSCNVDVGYYIKPPMFVYKSPSERPAKWDPELCEWTYKIPNENQFAPRLMSDEDEVAAQEKVATWMLIEYQEAVIQGVLNLLYVSLGDERAGGTYALHTELIKDILRNESYASTNN
jgi:hypothetical protein